MQVDVDTSKVAEIIERHQHEPRAIIGILQDVQEEYRHIPRAVVTELSNQLGVPKSRIYSIATFFKAFSLTPLAKHHICVCVGTACHVRGGQRIVNTVRRELGINPGETTPDLQFGLEAVRCLGCCALAPVVTIGPQLYSQVTQTKLTRILSERRKESAAGG